MSKILVDTIDTRSGTTTLTLGSSNAGTIALGSGDVQSNFLYPAFEAYASASQTVTSNTTTKAQINTELFDTDGCYDNSTNYRFTPTVAGKYFVYGSIQGETDASQMQFMQVYIYKNGSSYNQRIIDFRNNNGLQAGVSTSAIIDMNGSSDYVELYGKVLYGGGSAPKFQYGSSDEKMMQFGAYRVGT